MKATSVNANKKLRRDRQFSEDSPIQSQIPSDLAPFSRRFRPKSAPRWPTVGVLSEAALDDPEQAINRTICGDAVRVLRKLPRNWIPCAITSPPYWNTVDYGAEGQIGTSGYTNYLDALDQVWMEIDRVLIPNGKFCLNVPLLPLTKQVSGPEFGPTHTRVLLDLYSDMKRRVEEKTSLRLYSLYVWEKQTTEKMFGSYPFPPNLYERNYIEFIAVFVKPGSPRILPAAAKANSRISQEDWMDLTSQIWWMYPDNVPRIEGHPAPFPEALPNRLIAMYTFGASEAANFPGDIVLDPFAGSGTTCVAARRLGRRFIGIDLNLEFCTFAYNRIISTPIAPRVMSGKRPKDRPSDQLSLLEE